MGITIFSFYLIVHFCFVLLSFVLIFFFPTGATTIFYDLGEIRERCGDGSSHRKWSEVCMPLPACCGTTMITIVYRGRH